MGFGRAGLVALALALAGPATSSDDAVRYYKAELGGTVRVPPRSCRLP